VHAAGQLITANSRSTHDHGRPKPVTDRPFLRSGDIAAVLKSMGYATGQFGKEPPRHLQMNSCRPAWVRRILAIFTTRRDGIPAHRGYPQNCDTVARNMSTAGHRNRRSDACRVRQGRQAEDRDAARSIQRMETVDDEIRDLSSVHDKAKPTQTLFVGSTDAHAHRTHLSPNTKRCAIRRTLDHS